MRSLSMAQESLPSQATGQAVSVEPPQISLHFSLNPTAQDICRARLFEEPLVPIGADPTPAENAALGAALLAYSKRSGPDDFSGLTGFLETYSKSPWHA